MYNVIAEYYDLFTYDFPRKEWNERYLSVIGDRKSGVDAACGTGESALALSSHGCKVVGIDACKEMLSVAMAKARNAGLSIDFVRQDISCFSVPNKVDFVTAVCDGVNHLGNPTGFFTSAYDALKDGGVLAFDVSSEYKLTKVLANNVFTDTVRDVTYIWQNVLKTKNGRRCVDMFVTLFRARKSGYYEKSEGMGRQFVHTADSLVKTLKEVGFKTVTVGGEKSATEVREEDERIFFAAYK